MARIAWQEKTTDSGIQIAGGPTTIECKGEILGCLPGQDQQGRPLILYIVKRDDDNAQPHMVNSGAARFID